MPEAMRYTSHGYTSHGYTSHGYTMATRTMAIPWLYRGYTYYGAREQHARGDELRLGGAAAVEGEGRQRVGGDHAVQHEDLLLLHCRDQRAVALVSGGWWVVRSYSKQ